MADSQNSGWSITARGLLRTFFWGFVVVALWGISLATLLLLVESEIDTIDDQIARTHAIGTLYFVVPLFTISLGVFIAANYTPSMGEINPSAAGKERRRQQAAASAPAVFGGGGYPAYAGTGTGTGATYNGLNRLTRRRGGTR